MEKVRIVIILLLILVALPAGFARIEAQGKINPKSVSEITVRIIQEGTLEISGFVDKANLSLYIPQEGIQSQSVEADGASSHEYVYDVYGNRKLLIKWQNPQGNLKYKVTTVVNNKAKKFRASSGVATSADYLQETESIVIDDAIRKFAFPYEKSWQRVAEMTAEVYKLMEYDISMVGARKNSAWALENKRGVCVEHANLLAAMLRAAGISTRYVTGYAYSVVDDRLIGHTWVEVLAEDGSWVSFDPTWLEGGYLDATHIKTAALPDDAQEDVLTYYGTGTIKWKRGSLNSEYVGSAAGDLYADTIDVLEIKTGNVTKLSITGSDAVPFKRAGFIRAEIFSDTCVINDMTATSCVDSSQRKVLNIINPQQIVFSCDAEISSPIFSESMWFFEEDSSENDPYTCPVTVYDQIGTKDSFTVTADKREKENNIFISGPDIVGVNERFALHSSEDFGFIFYSEKFGSHSYPDWELSINKADTYDFFLFADNSLARKNVHVVDKKEFDISVDAPKNASLNQPITVLVAVKNLLDPKSLTVKLDFYGSYERTISLGKNEEKILFFNVTAKEAGTKKISASAIGDSIATTSTSIEIIDPKAEQKNPLQFLLDFFASVGKFFSSLF